MVSPGMESEASAKTAGTGPGGPGTKEGVPDKEGTGPEGAPDADKKRQVDQKLLQAIGILGACERMKMQEWRTAQAIYKLKADGAEAAEIAGMQKVYHQEVIQLRLMESEALDYRKKIGQLCNFEEMEQRWVRIATGVQNAVMSVGTTGATRLQRLLADPDTVNEVKDILDEICRDALIALGTGRGGIEE